MWGTDAVHGHNNIPGATIFPHNIGLGAARDPALIRASARSRRSRCASPGSTGPSPRVWRWYGMRAGDAPTRAMGRTRAWWPNAAPRMVEGLEGRPGTHAFLGAAHVLATAKHFIGDGGTGGQDEGDNTAGEEELRDADAARYVAALAAGVQTVMASFSSWQGVKMHGNRALLTGVLKERMGFDGLVIGDWDGHAQVPGCTSVSCGPRVNAGHRHADGARRLARSLRQHARAGQFRGDPGGAARGRGAPRAAREAARAPP